MPSLLRSSRRLQTLHQALTRHDYVRVARRFDHTDLVAGYVVDVGAEWLLMSVFDMGVGNGWVALRITDVDSMEPAPEGRFVRRGLESRQAWPPQPPDPALKLSYGMRDLVDSAHAQFSVIALFTERHGLTDFTLGRPLRWTAEGLHWQELGRDATWADDDRILETRSLTRLDVGGRYATALARVADLRGAP